MITFIQVALSLLLLFGCFFILVGALGLVKLDTFFKRLHAPTKASTLGVGCVLLGSVLYHIFLGEDPQPRELLITVFLFITAPISAHMRHRRADPVQPAAPVAAAWRGEGRARQLFRVQTLRHPLR